MVELRKKKEAEKNFISLKKKASLEVLTHGLMGQKAQVVGVLDISWSMSDLYQAGVVQDICEGSLALAVQFDDDGSIPIYLFGSQAHKANVLTESDFYQYVDREVLKRFQFEGDTCYARPLEMIINDHFPGALQRSRKGFLKKKELTINRWPEPVDPLFVMFFTDGDNSDKEDTELLIKEASKLPMFIQFIGIGKSRFSFLHKLDNLSGRLIDNAGFFEAPAIDKMLEQELMDGLLNEFPEYVLAARAKSLIV